MFFLKKKVADEVNAPMDLDEVMKKYDRESNTRVWEGTPKIIVNVVLAAFALFCIYVTLFTSWLEEIRLPTFMACIVLIGYLMYPVKKGKQRTNFMPWYDWALMILGTGAFLYFTFNAMDIIRQGSRLSLAEVCRRSVGLPILFVAGALLIYALIVLPNPTLTGKLSYMISYLFYSKEGILSTPVNVCSKFIVVFIIFGSFLERTGIADFFINISNAVVGGFSG